MVRSEDDWVATMRQAGRIRLAHREKVLAVNGYLPFSALKGKSQVTVVRRYVFPQPLVVLGSILRRNTVTLVNR